MSVSFARKAPSAIIYITIYSLTVIGSEPLTYYLGQSKLMHSPRKWNLCTFLLYTHKPWFNIYENKANDASTSKMTRVAESILIV